MTYSEDAIARTPVKCSDCSIWWRGLTHRCIVPPVPTRDTPPDSWKKYKKDYDKRGPNDPYIATTPEKNLNTSNVNYKKVWDGPIV